MSASGGDICGQVRAGGSDRARAFSSVATASTYVCVVLGPFVPSQSAIVEGDAGLQQVHLRSCVGSCEERSFLVRPVLWWWRGLPRDRYAVGH